MIVMVVSVLTILAVVFGFSFGRQYEAEQYAATDTGGHHFGIERRRPERLPVSLDLHPSEWERTA